METMNDIRREEGNPRAGDPTTATPEPVNREFRNAGSPARLTGLIVLMVGVVTIFAGIVLLVIPISIVGVFVALAGGFFYYRAYVLDHATHPHR